MQSPPFAVQFAWVGPSAVRGRHSQGSVFDPVPNRFNMARFVERWVRGSFPATPPPKQVFVFDKILIVPG